MTTKPQYAIGTRGILAGRRLKLEKHVVLGSWQLPSGGRGYNLGWYVTYSTVVCGVVMEGYEVVSDREMVRVLTFAEFIERRAA